MAKVLTAAPVMPNAGLRAEYEQKLEAMLDSLGKRLVPVFTGAWGDLYELQFNSALAQDASYAVMIADYERRMAEALEAMELEAACMAEWFATSASKHASTALAHNVSAAIGGRVALQMSPEVTRRTMEIVNENAGLIRSIASQYTEQLTEAMAASVTAGRDLGGLYKALTERMGVAQSRAKLIATDQNNKATSAIDRLRKQELGITQSLWKHIPVAKQPRPSHMKADGAIYNNIEGCLIDGKLIWPGEEINCHCISRAVIPGRSGGNDLSGEWSLSTGETSKGIA